MSEAFDAVIVGGGLAGLVAASELAERRRRVLILEQESARSLGGQAYWSLGGLFMVDTPEQRRLRIRDSLALATQDWTGSARFDRPEDDWPRRWAEAYLTFAAGDMRDWLAGLGMRWFPVVGWAERGGALADGHGNSVPRFHVTWGAGPGVLAPFVEAVQAACSNGRVTIRYRHRVTDLVVTDGAVTGVHGTILKGDAADRGAKSSQESDGAFEVHADSVLLASGGIGGNVELVRRHWPTERLGPAPRKLVCGVPHHVDGRMQEAATRVGARLINADRMWHYTEGVANWDPVWPDHGIRILPGPSSLWVDALGNRLPAPCFPGFDTLSTLKHILSTGHDHSWFVLTQSIIEKEFALSGSEQNPDLCSGRWAEVLKTRFGKGAPASVEAFKRHGADFVVRDSLSELVGGMNSLIGAELIEPDRLRAQVEARDRELDNPFSKDAQVSAIRGARRYLGDRLVRTAKPHRLLDPAHGPLIAVRLSILTRKSLGGLQTNLSGQVLDRRGEPIGGLHAAGEVSGFGGGGYHGYNALEGTFLGGCLFTGREAGRAMAGAR